MGLCGGEAVAVGGGDTNLDQAGLRGDELQAPCPVQGHGLPSLTAYTLAAHFDGDGGNAAPGIGADGGDDGLARLRRRARGRGDEDLGLVRGGVGDHAQGEGLRRCVLAVARLCGGDEVADLAWAWGPG